MTPIGHYTADGVASMIRVDALNLAFLDPTLPSVAFLDITRSEASADSERDPFRTRAFSGNVGESTLLDQPLDQLIPPVIREAPGPDEGFLSTEIEIPINPVLHATLLRQTAEANWAGDTECVAADDVLAAASQEVAGATVLAPETGQNVVGVDDGEDGVSNTISITNLPSIPGPNDRRAVQSFVSTQVAGADLLNGFGIADAPLDSLISIQVVQAPNYTVRATGLPDDPSTATPDDGASVTGDDPIIRVFIAGQFVAEMTAGESFNEPVLALPALVDILDALSPLLEGLAPVVEITVPKVVEIAEDGTSASVSAAIARVRVLTALSETEPLIDVILGPLEASATAPLGGLECGERENPLRELDKDVSAATVVPGGTFEYVIMVPNRDDECTLTEVRVSDVITGPAGTTIADTDPDANPPTGTSTDGGATNTVVWDDIGPIAPNETKTLTITVQVPTSAQTGQTYSDTVTVTANCDGTPYDNTARIIDIPRVVAPNSGGCAINASNKAASHIEVFPGETFNYYIHLLNSGGEPCNNVSVTDTLDPRVTFVSCTDGCTPPPDGRTVVWQNLGTLAPGSSRTLTITVQVKTDATGNLPNVAVINADGEPPHTVQTPGPTVTTRSILAPDDPPGQVTLARTGGAFGLVWYGVASALGAAALGLQRLRRRALG